MNILTLCTANIRRSPMALGILERIIKQNNIDATVKSFGLAAFDGQAVDNCAVKALQEIGIDISNHKALRVFEEDFKDADIIYVMTYSQKYIIIDALPDLEDIIKVLDIPDPLSGSISEFRECRDFMINYFKEEAENF